VLVCSSSRSIARFGSTPSTRLESIGPCWSFFDKASQEAFTVIFFSAFCASDTFGSVTVSTPFLKLASILSVSTPSGTRK
jgi:hypothetical protein